MTVLKRLIVEEEGQGLVEYSLILGLVAVAIWGAIFLLDIPTEISKLWKKIADSIKDAPE